MAITAKLKASGDKASLLSKAPHATPRGAQSGDTTASSLVGGHAARGGAGRVSGPSTNKWFGSGENKKKREMRPPWRRPAQRWDLLWNYPIIRSPTRLKDQENLLPRSRRLLTRTSLPTRPRSQKRRAHLTRLRPRVVPRSFRQRPDLRLRPLNP